MCKQKSHNEPVGVIKSYSFAVYWLVLTWQSTKLYLAYLMNRQLLYLGMNVTLAWMLPLYEVANE